MSDETGGCWVYWQSANGSEGQRTEFPNRREAEHYVEVTVRRFAADLEHGTGEAGEWTPDGRLFRGDLDVELGRFIIEDSGARTSTDDRSMRSAAL